MGLNQYGLGILFNAKDTATPTVKRVGVEVETTTTKTKAMQKQFVRAGADVAKGVGMMAVGLKGLQGLHGLVKEFAGFEAVVTSAAAIAGASAGGYNKLYKAAQRAGIETMFSPRQAALGLRVLSQAGLNVQDSMKALLPSLKLATASFGELGPQQTAGLVTIAMKTFGISADKVGAAVGRMVHATNTAKMSVGDLELGLAGASRGSLALKQSLSETLISLGLIKNAGFRTQRAATNLSMAMARVADPNVQKKLKELNVVVADSTGKFRPFLDVIQDVTAATSTMTDKKKAAFLQDVFGAEALGGLMAIMNQLEKGIKTSTGEIVKGTAAVEHLRGGMVGAGDAANKMSTKYLATMEGKFKLMKGSLDTLKIAIGGVFVKTFLPVVQGITGAVNKMIKTVESLPAPIRSLIGALAPLGATALTIVGLTKAFRGMLGMMAAARGAMAMGAATQGVATAADAAGMAVNRFGMLTTGAQAAQVQFIRTASHGDLMLHEMNQKLNVGAARASKFTRITRGMGAAVGKLPIAGAAAALGFYGAKMIASHSAMAKSIAAHKKMNIELSKRIEITRTMIELQKTQDKLAQSEHEGIRRIAASIKTRKDAERALISVDKILGAQKIKVMSAYSKAADMAAKAALSGKVSDKLAADAAKKRALVEQVAFESMGVTRERVIAKLAEHDVKKTRKASLEVLNMYASMAFVARRDLAERAESADKAARLLVEAEKGGNEAHIEFRKKRLTQLETAEKNAAAKMKSLIAKGAAIGVALGRKPKQAEADVIARMRALRAGGTAPALALGRELRVGAEAREMGPRAAVPTIGGLAGAPILMLQNALSSKLEEMIRLENKAMKLRGKQPIVVHVTVGDQTITKSVKNQGGEDTESLGDIVVKTVGGFFS